MTDMIELIDRMDIKKVVGMIYRHKAPGVYRMYTANPKKKGKSFLLFAVAYPSPGYDNYGVIVWPPQFLDRMQPFKWGYNTVPTQG